MALYRISMSEKEESDRICFVDAMERSFNRDQKMFVFVSRESVVRVKNEMKFDSID